MAPSLVRSWPIQISFNTTGRPFSQPCSSISMASKTRVPQPRSGSAPCEDMRSFVRIFLVIVGVNCNDELRRLPSNTLYGRIQAQRPLVAKGEGSKEFDKRLKLLFRIQSKSTQIQKNIRTAIKSNVSLTITEERQQNQTLVITFSMIIPKVAWWHGSSAMTCCILHKHSRTF